LIWLGRQDSNLGMAESKSAALPLGYAPTGGSLPPWRADHSGETWTDQRPSTVQPLPPLTIRRAARSIPVALPAAIGPASTIAGVEQGGESGEVRFRRVPRRCFDAGRVIHPFQNTCDGPPPAAFLQQRLQITFYSRPPSSTSTRFALSLGWHGEVSQGFNMNKVKILLLGTAAGVVAAGGAQAADMPTKAQPVQYVKICSLYGDGFYYIPGTDTCLKLGGYLRV
jgi:hypothetical protein